MDERSKPAETRDPRVEAAIRDYLEGVDRGEAVNREEFISGHAEIADALRSFFAAEEPLRKMAVTKISEQSAGISTRSIAAQGQETVPPESQPDRRPGTTGSGLAGQFGRYQIIRALGSGAMGAVYLAQDTQLKRYVAIKTPHFEDDPTGELLKRFYREAEAAATLLNANICPVYDVGQIDGKHFISMAYIEGKLLSDLIHSGKAQHERQIVTAIHKLAKALQQAHDHGIVHRDLKPANIMVNKQGEPVIMDFGLARKRRAEGETSLTHSGMLLGSPAYMSPEQIEGDPESVGPASDQYSLGVVLYEMLTRQLPFRGSVVNVLAQILTKDLTRPSELRPGLDPRIEALCLRMMAKKASNRFPSMKAVAEELYAILKSPAAEPIAGDKSPTASRSPAAPAPSRGDAGTSQIRKSVKAKALTESDMTSLEELVRKCLRRRDYDQVIQIIERIPEERRNAELQTLLEMARGKADEISFLICEIDEADRLNDRPTALKKAEALLAIKPGHHRALEIQEKFSGYGEGGAARIGLVDQFRRPLNDGGWIPWSVLAFGLAVFGVMTGVIVIYLGRTAVVIDIKDPGVEVAVKGTTLTVTGPDKQSVKVEPGDQELKITFAGLEITSKSFSLKKGETKTVTVSIVNKEIVARLENEILPLMPAHEEKASDRTKAGKKEVVTIQTPEKKPANAALGTQAIEPKPNSATTPPKFFRPFLVRGEWRIENDELVEPGLATDDALLPLLIFGEPNFSNYDLSLEAKKTGGWDSIAVLFHWLSAGTCRDFSLAGNRGIALGYRYQDQPGLQDRNWKDLSYSSNRWYSLKIEVRRDKFRAYLDDVLQFEKTDTRFTHGRIGLSTHVAAARFRRIKVTDPQGNVLFEGLPELPPASNSTRPKGDLADSSRPLTTGEIASKRAQEKRAERLKTPVVSTNSIGMKLVLIPPGEFQMGSAKSERGREDQEQRHHVRITKPFYLGIYEVTQSEFERVLGRNPSLFHNSGDEAEKATGPDVSRNPVERVTWYDAVEFCNKLSEAEGRPPYYRIADIKGEVDGSIKDARVSIAGGNGYRLPTEAQWEYACRAGTTTPFSFGATNNGTECNSVGRVPYGTEQEGPALGRTVPVGSYRPNAFGLYDMHGNVWEWCWDVYDSDYYKHSPVSDPAGPASGEMRSIRGGGYLWGGGLADHRSAHRRGAVPTIRGAAEGFRVACDATGGQQFKPSNEASTSSADSPSHTTNDPDRRAAEWVLSIGGGIAVESDGEERDVGELPPGPFKLRKVHLNGNPKVSDAGLACFKGCRNLTALNLWDTKASDAGLSNFKDCKDLRELHLGGGDVTDSGLAHFKDCKDLKALDLYLAKVGDAGLARLGRLVNLEDLNLTCTGISDASLRNLGNLPRLKTLWLYGTQVTNDGLAYLERLTQIETLGIGGSTRIRGAGLVHLRTLVRLRELRLQGFGLMDGDLVHLRSLKALERLSLSDTRVFGPGLANLKALSQLRELDLNGSRMTTSGLEQLKNLPQLQRLRLRRTQVNNAGLYHLEGMTNLDDLDLSETKVTAAGVEKLQKSIPACKIIVTPRSP